MTCTSLHRVEIKWRFGRICKKKRITDHDLSPTFMWAENNNRKHWVPRCDSLVGRVNDCGFEGTLWKTPLVTVFVFFVTLSIKTLKKYLLHCTTRNSNCYFENQLNCFFYSKHSCVAYDQIQTDLSVFCD